MTGANMISADTRLTEQQENVTLCREETESVQAWLSITAKTSTAKKS